MAQFQGLQGRTRGVLSTSFGVPSINWQHPLAKGLVACYVPAYFPSGTMKNIAVSGSGDMTPLIAFNSPAFTPGITPDGRGLQYSGPSATVFGYSGAAPTSWQLSSGTSLFFRALRTGQFTNTQFVFLFGLKSSTSTNPWSIGGGLSPSGNGPLGLFYNTTAATYIGSITPPTGAMMSAGATFAAGAPGQLFINGVKDTLGGSPPNVALTYSGTITVLLGNTAGHPLNMTFTIGYIWTRPLSAAEHASLNANPYSLLFWPADMVYDALTQPSSTHPGGGKYFQMGFPMTVGLGAAAHAERWLRRRKAEMRRLRGE